MLFKIILGLIAISVILSDVAGFSIAIGLTISYTLFSVGSYIFNWYLYRKCDRLIEACHTIMENDGSDMTDEINVLIEAKEVLKEKMR